MRPSDEEQVDHLTLLHDFVSMVPDLHLLNCDAAFGPRRESQLSDLRAYSDSVADEHRQHEPPTPNLSEGHEGFTRERQLTAKPDRHRQHQRTVRNALAERRLRRVLCVDVQRVKVA